MTKTFKNASGVHVGKTSVEIKSDYDSFTEDFIDAKTSEKC